VHASALSLITMSEKQNPKLDRNGAPALAEEQTGVQDDSSRKSYYYDDSTGYEIYNDESDKDEEDDMQ
jgi:hypothetical protein